MKNTEDDIEPSDLEDFFDFSDCNKGVLWFLGIHFFIDEISNWNLLLTFTWNRIMTISEVRRTAPTYIYLYRERLMNIFKKFSIDMVIDVGAGHGNYASMLREIGFKGKILSIEPSKNVFEDLAVRAKNDAYWSVFNFALGSKESFQELNISEWSEFSSFFATNETCNNHFGQNAMHGKKETVPVKTLENFLKEKEITSKNIFIKIDTQGYDIEVFRGIGAYLSNVCALQTEVSLIPIYNSMPSIGESISFFENQGFMVAGLCPVSQNEHSLIIYEFDCLMIKANSKLTTSNGVTDVVPFCLNLLEGDRMV